MNVDVATVPNRNVVDYFGSRGMNPGGLILDIGSGAEANASFLRDLKWGVLTVDSDPRTKAYYHKDIREYIIDPGFYDAILDCNTLCHVENAPYQKIYDGLKGGGVFFSVHPMPETVPHIANGRWTRKASEHELRDSLKMFDPGKVWVRDCKIFNEKRGIYIKSFRITAEK